MEIQTALGRMAPTLAAALLLSAWASSGPGGHPAGPAEAAAPVCSLQCRLIRSLYDLSTLPLPEGTRSWQTSSQDNDHLEHYWDYFNSDELFLSRGFHIRQGYDGAREYVILPQTPGPGYLARLWFTHRQHNWALKEGEDPRSPEAAEWGFLHEVGNLRLYFDGEPVPRVDMPATRFFSGQVWPFIAPLVTHYGTGNGGNVSYVPLPFQRSLLVATTGLPRMFQVQLKTWEEEDPGSVQSFSLPLDGGSTLALQEAARAWWQPGRLGPAPAGERLIEREAILLPGQTLELELPGPASISALALRLPPGGEDGLRLALHWDGSPRPAVEGPLRALFGPAEAVRYWRSLPVGVFAEGGRHVFYNHLPMPFAREARLVVRSERSLPTSVHLRLRLQPTAAAQAQAAGRLQARSQRQRLPAREDDLGNYRLLQVQGQGRLVGVILTQYDVDRSTLDPHARANWPFPYLESDMNVWVDGAYALPGTGIEDDFNAGYYYIYTHVPGRRWQFATSGNLWKDERVMGEVVSQYRFYLSDKVEFQRSLLVEVEHGIKGNNLAVTYSSTAFWYQD